MLVARDLVRHHGGQVVLDAVTLSVPPRARYGVVGPNGIGKSTLLRILAGVEAPDGGVVERSPATLTVGWMPQEPDARPGETLAGYLARRTGVAAAGADLDAATDALSADAATIDAHAVALERFLALGGDDLEARTGAVLDRVGLPADRAGVAVGDLSGGQAARAALAALLLSRHDVLLLDEPTNDLDFAGLDLLESTLRSTPAAVVAVSHDRAFLDRVAERIVELRLPRHDIVEHAGGWSDFVASRALARRQQEQGYERFVAERDRLVERQRTQRSWSDSGARVQRRRTDGDKFVAHRKAQRSEQLAGKIKATERRIERLDAVEAPWEPWRLELAVNPAERAGDVVAALEGAVVELGSFRLGPVDLELGWRDRVAVLGPNGSGKSTLLRALLGEVPLAAGRRRLGPGVRVGLLDQRRARYGGSTTLLAGFMAATGLDRPTARTALAKLGLGADHVDRPGAALSPGERTRAVLGELSANGVNCLVLDEPTNHLDVEAIEQLESVLDRYEGTVVLVTHDRALLEAVSLDRAVELDAGRATLR